MAVNFTVETGAGLEDATSYASVEQFLQYNLDFGNADYSALDEDKIKTYLNKATAYIDMSYCFQGIRYTDTQALSFPRYDLYDRKWVYISFGTLPKDLISAVCYLAGVIAEGTEIFQINSGISSQSVAGISANFTNNGQKSFPVVDRLLNPFIIHGSKLLRVN